MDVAQSDRPGMGMLILGVWLILTGISGLMPLGIPSPLTAALPLIAGVFIILGR